MANARTATVWGRWGGAIGSVLALFLLAAPGRASAFNIEISPPVVVEQEAFVAVSGLKEGFSLTEVIWSVCETEAGSCSEVARSPGSGYTPPGSDAGKYLKAKGIAQWQGTPEKEFAEARVVLIQGSEPTTPVVTLSTLEPGVGQEIKGSAESKGFPTPTLSYQWESCSKEGKCEPIAEQNAPTLVVSSQLKGRRLRLRVEATAEAGGWRSQPVVGYSALTFPVGELYEIAPPKIVGVSRYGEGVQFAEGSWSEAERLDVEAFICSEPVVEEGCSVLFSGQRLCAGEPECRPTSRFVTTLEEILNEEKEIGKYLVLRVVAIGREGGGVIEANATALIEGIAPGLPKNIVWLAVERIFTPEGFTLETRIELNGGGGGSTLGAEHVKEGATVELVGAGSTAEPPGAPPGILRTAWTLCKLRSSSCRQVAAETTSVYVEPGWGGDELCVTYYLESRQGKWAAAGPTRTLCVGVLPTAGYVPPGSNSNTNTLNTNINLLTTTQIDNTIQCAVNVLINTNVLSGQNGNTAVGYNTSYEAAAGDTSGTGGAGVGYQPLQGGGAGSCSEVTEPNGLIETLAPDQTVGVTLPFDIVTQTQLTVTLNPATALGNNNTPPIIIRSTAAAHKRVYRLPVGTAVATVVNNAVILTPAGERLFSLLAHRGGRAKIPIRAVLEVEGKRYSVPLNPLLLRFAKPPRRRPHHHHPKPHSRQRDRDGDFDGD